MTESNFGQKLRKSVLAVDANADWQRIENRFSGTPDVNVAINGRDWWLELKWLDKLPVRTIKLGKGGLTVKQRNWIQRRSDAGSLCAVVLGIKRGPIYVVPPSLCFVGSEPYEEFLNLVRQGQIKRFDSTEEAAEFLYKTSVWQ